MRPTALLACLLLICNYAVSQSTSTPSNCGVPEVILQRYLAAVGGETAVSQMRTLAIEADESEPHTFNPKETRRSRYKFKWKFPNRVAVKERYLLSTGSFIFDSTGWTNFDGRISHNEDNTPSWRRELKSTYPYNDNPNFMMFRVVANPILLATTRNLYSGFKTLASVEGTCLLQASGTTEWKTERRDVLHFDQKSGFLKTWEIQAGLPQQVSYVRFQFDDYQQAGDVKIPTRIYFDFYKATFRLTKVTPNAPLSDAEFVPKAAARIDNR